MYDRAPNDKPRRRQKATTQVLMPSPARSRSSMSTGAIVGYAVLGIVCAVLAGVSFLLIAAPVDLVRDRLVEEVKAHTGRDLTVAGAVSLSLFPSPGVSLNQVSLAAPPGMGGGPTFTAQRLNAQMSLGSLLSRRLQVHRVVLTQPGVNLVVDRNGRRSWDFALWEGRRIRLAQAKGPVMRDAGVPRGAAVDPQQVLRAVADALPGEVRIENGFVRYRDERSGENFELTGLDADLGANDVTSPVVARGRFVLRGQALDYSASLSSLEAAIVRGKADVAIRAKGAPLDAQFEGTLGLTGGKPRVDGNVVVRSPSLAALGLWLGQPMAVAGDLQFSSRVQFAGQKLSLVNFDGALSGRAAQGYITVDFVEPRPRVTGSVEMASLDLGTLLMRDAADGPPNAPGGPRKDPIGDLLKQQQPKGPQVRGYKRRSGDAQDWSDDQLDVRLLAMADADIKLSARSIVYHDLKTGPSRVAFTLVDRQLRIDLEDLDLYQGRGRGVVTIDAAAATPASTVNLTLENVAAGAFLKDAVGQDWIDGPTFISVAVAGQGGTERQFVESLSGTVEIKTNGGTLSGFNIPKMVRSIETGQIPPLQVQASEKTAFSEFGATYVISKGVAQNNDLRLYTQHARLSGSGLVNLPRRTLDYNLKARITGTGATPGQGAVVNFSNIEIPIRVEGPWDKPTIGIKGQEQILEALRQVGKVLKNPEVNDVLRGLLGGKQDGPIKPGELLEKFFKK